MTPSISCCLRRTFRCHRKCSCSAKLRYSAIGPIFQHHRVKITLVPCFRVPVVASIRRSHISRSDFPTPSYQNTFGSVFQSTTGRQLSTISLQSIRMLTPPPSDNVSFACQQPFDSLLHQRVKNYASPNAQCAMQIAVAPIDLCRPHPGRAIAAPLCCRMHV